MNKSKQSSNKVGDKKKRNQTNQYLFIHTQSIEPTKIIDKIAKIIEVQNYQIINANTDKLHLYELTNNSKRLVGIVFGSSSKINKYKKYFIDILELPSITRLQNKKGNEKTRKETYQLLTQWKEKKDLLETYNFLQLPLDVSKEISWEEISAFLEQQDTSNIIVETQDKTTIEIGKEQVLSNSNFLNIDHLIKIKAAQEVFGIQKAMIVKR